MRVDMPQADGDVAQRDVLAEELSAMRAQQAEFLRLRTQLERMQVSAQH